MKHLKIMYCRPKIDLIDDYIRVIEINSDVVLNACKDIDLELTWGKNKWAYLETRQYRSEMTNYI